VILAHRIGLSGFLLFMIVPPWGSAIAKWPLRRIRKGVEEIRFEQCPSSPESV